MTGPSQRRSVLAAVSINGDALADHPEYWGDFDVVLAAARDPGEREPLSAVIPLTVAELRHMARHEWARRPEDALARRCRLAMVDEAEAQRLRPLVQAVLAEECQGSCSPTIHQ